ncbi:MAG: hypothetical protein Kow0037_02560 [Calditrichia bacterium]
MIQSAGISTPQAEKTLNLVSVQIRLIRVHPYAIIQSDKFFGKEISQSLRSFEMTTVVNFKHISLDQPPPVIAMPQAEKSLIS